MRARVGQRGGGKGAGGWERARTLHELCVCVCMCVCVYVCVGVYSCVWARVRARARE